MNERINQLAREAGLIAPYGSDREGLRDFDYRMFAQLIVKETMQIVANQLPSNQYLDVAHAVIEHYKDADVT